MFTYLILEVLSGISGAVALVLLIIHLIKNPVIHNIVKQKGIYIPLFLCIIFIGTGFLANRTYPPNFAMPAFMHSHAPGKVPAAIPFNKIFEFLLYKNNFKHIDNISADPTAVPTSAQSPEADGIVHISLTAKEVIAEIAPGIYFNYWTYNEQVPGPMLRVREGDTIELSLTNDPASLHHHNIDLHAVTGPGGGSVVTNVNPGETKTFRWKALNPGLYIYHCAMPNVSTHNSHGQYGLILVDPKDPTQALDPVDKEFYIVQGELYTVGTLGKRGLVPFDSNALLSADPNYVVFNGKIEDTPRMHARVGDRIRIYVGNGGVNLISSFHVIGEIFDTIYPEASLGKDSTIFKNVQTTIIPAGGATIVEFTVDTPGKFILVDHALARMNKGAWAVLQVEGKDNSEIFSTVTSTQNNSINHIMGHIH